MKKLHFILLALVIGFIACDNDDDAKKDPTIELITASGYTYENTTIVEGDSVLIGFKAEYNGDDNIISIEIAANGTTAGTETVDNLELERSYWIKKSFASEEEWVFTVTDAGGLSTSVSVTLILTYREIDTNESIILGAQENATLGSFYSINDDNVYFQDAAFNDHQDAIDLIYYYEAGDENVIASAGANISDDIFTGASGLTNWTTLNETRYYKTSISTAEFDAVANDSLLTIAFNALDAKRKAKTLNIDDVYSFLTESGKFGMFKVVAMDGQATGNIEIALKVQK